MPPESGAGTERDGATGASLSRVAALFVAKDGAYFGLDGVDPWDEDRDARTYAGPYPVVAHPPCAAWSRLAGFRQAVHGYKRGEDGGCFKAALHAVRAYGGVLEHPAHTDAFKTFGLPRPTVRQGWTLDMDGGASCYIEQGRYGLPVKKATWLYAYGVDLPELRWGWTRDSEGDPENQTEHGGIDAWRDAFKGRRESWIAGAPNRAVIDRDGDRRNRPSHLGITSTTPPEFRDVLLAMARSAYSLRSVAA